MMAGERDSAGRRKRTEAQSTGKRLNPTERDMLWFQKIYEHGPLTPTYLHAFSQHQWVNENKARERFTHLFHESNTPHQGSYLKLPKQQFETEHSERNEYVYDLSKASERALAEVGFSRAERKPTSNPWKHHYMVSCITASIEIATLGRDDLRYIPASEILARANTTLRCPTSIRWPGAEKPVVKDLIPDGLFGLEYVVGEHKRYRFFIVEADRGTEPATTATQNRKSYQRHILQYRDYIGGEKYKEHLKLTAPLLVLNVSPIESRRQLHMNTLLDLAGDTGSNYQLFQTFPEFGKVFVPPPVQLQFLAGDWVRVGMEAIPIDAV